MTFWQWLGLAKQEVVKEFDQLVSDAENMAAELEGLAQRKAQEINAAFAQIKLHENVIALAQKAQNDAVSAAAVVRATFQKAAKAEDTVEVAVGKVVDTVVLSADQVRSNVDQAATAVNVAAAQVVAAATVAETAVAAQATEAAATVTEAAAAVQATVATAAANIAA